MRSPVNAEQYICEISFLYFQLCPNTDSYPPELSLLESVSHPLLPGSLSALDSTVFRAEFSHLLIKRFFSEQLSQA